MISHKFMIFRGTKLRKIDGLMKVVTKVPFSKDRKIRLADAMESILNRDEGTMIYNTLIVHLKTDDVRLNGYIIPWGRRNLHAWAQGKEPNMIPLYNVLKEYMPEEDNL